MTKKTQIILFIATVGLGVILAVEFLILGESLRSLLLLLQWLFLGFLFLIPFGQKNYLHVARRMKFLRLILVLAVIALAGINFYLIVY
ncbi:MAG: hypothetical protein AAB360_04400 [Patescibacteria group bacterium]